MNELENGWLDMSTAPKDGRPILVAHNNDLFWEYYVVWWYAEHPYDSYPWHGDNNSYPDENLSAWKPIDDGPYEIN